MVDRRRDKTAEIPPATIAELLASRKKLAPRQETTDLTGAAQDVRAALEENEQQMLRMVTKAPVPRAELEEQIGPHLEPFSPARRAAVLQAFEIHAYARGMAMLDDDVKRQPKNLSMSTEARALRLLALSRLETEMGGLHVVPRVAKPLSTIAAPPDLENLFPFIDGHSPIERILRLSKIERLKGLDFLASLARSGHIDLPVSTVVEPDRLSIPPLSSRSQTRPKVGSNPPPAPEPVFDPYAEPPELIPLDGVEPVGAAPPPSSQVEPTPLPMQMPMQAPQSAAPVSASIPTPEPEPPSSRVSTALAASSRTLRVRAPSPKRGLPPAVLVALGAVVMIGIFVGIAALRRSASQPAAPAGATLTPTSSPQPLPQPKPVATTEQQAAPKTDSPELESIRVKIKVQPTYARVTVDGVVFTGTDIEVKLAKDSKQHVLKVDAPGYKPHTANFTAEESASFTIALDRIPPRH